MLLLLASLSASIHPATTTTSEPSVMVSILARNAAAHLPYFLAYLEEQSYPKARLGLWLRCEDSMDGSCELLNAWLDRVRPQYLSVHASSNLSESGPPDWRSSPSCEWRPHCW